MWKPLNESSAVTEPGEFAGDWLASAAGYIRDSLRRLGVAFADLEDAVQETLLAVYRKRDEYDPSQPLKPWLFGFAVRVAANARRKRRGCDGWEIERSTGTDYCPERRALVAEAQAIAQRALEGMAVERSVVFSLHELQGLSASEIAEIVAVPTNTVYSRLRVARVEFSRAVGELTRSASAVC